MGMVFIVNSRASMLVGHQLFSHDLAGFLV